MKSLLSKTAPLSNKTEILKYIKRDKYLYMMLIPIMLYYVIFKYGPMYGLIIAFKNYTLSGGILGSEWVGLAHFKRLFSNPDFYKILKNTLWLNFCSIIFYFPVPIILAIMINDVKNNMYKRLVQSFLYIPHFISWVVLGKMLVSMLSPSTGIVNSLLKGIGIEPIFFLGDTVWWQITFVVSSIWQGAGWGTIIYLSTITLISSELYEAAKIDGAGKLRQIWHVTLPGIRSTVAIMLILRVGTVMDVGFEHIYALSNASVRDVADVISTYIYRIGVQGAKYSYTAAIGLFQSIIAFILIVSANTIVKKLGENGLW